MNSVFLLVRTIHRPHWPSATNETRAVVCPLTTETSWFGHLCMFILTLTDGWACDRFTPSSSLWCLLSLGFSPPGFRGLTFGYWLHLLYMSVAALPVVLERASSTGSLLAKRSCWRESECCWHWWVPFRTVFYKEKRAFPCIICPKLSCGVALTLFK